MLETKTWGAEWIHRHLFFSYISEKEGMSPTSMWPYITWICQAMIKIKQHGPDKLDCLYSMKFVYCIYKPRQMCKHYPHIYHMIYHMYLDRKSTDIADFISNNIVEKFPIVIEWTRKIS